MTRKIFDFRFSIFKYSLPRRFRAERGFTLVETLVAISLLAIAIVAPMSLTTQSLMGAYYARDQVTAFFLAQEAIEAVRSMRDANVLTTALGTPTDLMAGIPSSGVPFTVDAHTVPVTLAPCPNSSPSSCPALQTDGELYGYNFTPAGSVTNFTRYVIATYVAGTSNNEIQISATVVWQTAAYEPRTFTLKENLYRWIFDSAASSQVTNPPGSQIFTSSGTFTVPAYDNSLTVQCWGGGGGGGCDDGAVSNGGNGLTSSFGSISATGGFGGQCDVLGVPVSGGGAGGSGSGGDTNSTGVAGQIGTPTAYGGAGGAAAGSGGSGGIQNTVPASAGATGSTPGGGGAGGYSGSGINHGGGGGGGGYVSKAYPIGQLAVGSNIAVTVGTGGAAGVGIPNGGAGARGECRISWN